MNEIQSKASILLVLGFLAFTLFAVTNTWADEVKPSPADYANLEDIKTNQKILAETREAHERFEQAKEWNELEVSELARNGWCVTWDTLELVTCSSRKASPVSDDKRELLTGPCNGDERCICITNGIFKHDSGWATAGVGKKALNPGNMRIPRTWTPSVEMSSYNSGQNGIFAKFNSLEDGIRANVELYQRFYAQYENADALVSVWADGGGDASYRAAVANCF